MAGVGCKEQMLKTHFDATGAAVAFNPKVPERVIRQATCYTFTNEIKNTNTNIIKNPLITTTKVG